MKVRLTNFIDLFYPPFKRIMPQQTFRYAACGAFNTLLGLALYSFCYSYIFKGADVLIGSFAFQPHTVSLFISFCFNFCLGFILNRYIVFTASNLRGRIQLFRYFLSFLSNLGINYILLKSLVELAGWNALISQYLTTVVIVFISYLSQKHFSFRNSEPNS
jgi:hypothetical protein